MVAWQLPISFGKEFNSAKIFRFTSTGGGIHALNPISVLGEFEHEDFKINGP